VNSLTALTHSQIDLAATLILATSTGMKLGLVAILALILF